MSGELCVLLAGTAPCALLIYACAPARLRARVRLVGAWVVLEYRVARYDWSVRRLDARKARALAFVEDLRRREAILARRSREWFGDA